MTTTTHEAWLKMAVDLAEQSVAEGGGPFGAVVVREGKLVSSARNRVTERCDPSAHAEVEALRLAGRASGSPHLMGCILYASCEPCPMCLATALWAHVEQIVFAAPHQEAQRAGFDDSAIALQLYGAYRPVNLPTGLLQQLPIAGAGRPFDAWLAKGDRQHY